MPQLNHTLWILLTAALLIMMQCAGLLLAFKKWYHPCPPGKALIRTGTGLPWITTGRGLWVIPPFHQSAVLSIAPMRIALARSFQDAAEKFSGMMPDHVVVAVSLDQGVSNVVMRLAGMDEERLFDLANATVNQVCEKLRAEIVAGSVPPQPIDQLLDQWLEPPLNKLGFKLLVS